MELRGAALVRVPAALNRASLSALQAAVSTAAAEDRRCAVLLRASEPGVFCAGLDFAALAGGEDPAGTVEGFAACLDGIRRCPKPVICLVEGKAEGGGVGVAAACDTVFATPDASFALPELLFGLIPGVVLPFLTERLTPQRLRWLALSSERIDAITAAEMGLVDRVEPEPGCILAIESGLRRLARLSPDAVRAWKGLTAMPSPIGSSEGWLSTLGRLRNPEILERLRRFAEDGEPPWRLERT